MLRLQEQIPDLLEGYQEEFTTSGGFELASFVGASGSAIIWPCDINRSDILIVTMPKIVLSDQGKSLRGILPYLEDHEVYASISRFKKARSSRVIKENLSESGDWREAVSKINSYIRQSEMLNEMSEVTTTDIRTHIK